MTEIKRRAEILRDSLVKHISHGDGEWPDTSSLGDGLLAGRTSPSRLCGTCDSRRLRVCFPEAGTSQCLSVSSVVFVKLSDAILVKGSRESNVLREAVPKAVVQVVDESGPGVDEDPTRETSAAFCKSASRPAEAVSPEAVHIAPLSSAKGGPAIVAAEEIDLSVDKVRWLRRAERGGRGNTVRRSAFELLAQDREVALLNVVPGGGNPSLPAKGSPCRAVDSEPNGPREVGDRSIAVQEANRPVDIADKGRAPCAFHVQHAVDHPSDDGRT